MTECDVTRVAHIVPAMNIGGVEVAIARSHGHLNESVDYQVYYVRKRGSLDCGQQHVIHLMWTCITGGWRPDVIVSSLWWSHPFGALLKVFGASWVAFFHNCGFTGGAQRAILKYAWHRADTRLVDSEATGAFYCAISDNDYHIVPYIFQQPAEGRDWLSRRYDIVWVGRNVAAKRADLVVAFMRQIASIKTEGSLCLIAAGEVPAEFAGIDLGPGWTTSIRQSLDGDRVLTLLADSRFFLLTSDFEGMSMVTIEAMFAGCVPIVRLVGELKNYIGDDHELVIPDGNTMGMAALAERVAERWEDIEFADSAVRSIKSRIAIYSTYEQEFLSAVTNSCGHPPA